MLRVRQPVQRRRHGVQRVVQVVGLRVDVEQAGDDLYAKLDKRYKGFSGHELISGYEFSSDWPNWERHPHGDEIIVLLSGRVEFILQTEDGEIGLQLSRQGEYVLIPKNVWHTARTNHYCKLLFITPGEGTQHKAVAQA